MTQHKLCALDYETFFTTEFSITRMTNEQYVSDTALFDTICVSLWIPEWGTDIRVAWGSIDTLRDAILELIPDFDERMVLAWNAKFDGSVTEWRLGLAPLGWICVMSMFGAMYGMGSACSLKKATEFLSLPPKLDGLQRKGARHTNMTAQEKAETERYCQHDTRLCILIFYELLKDGFPEAEIGVLSATDQCYLRSPVVLNAELAATALVEERARRAAILDNLRVPAEALRSDQQFAELMRAEGVEPPLKVSPSNPEKLIHAFAKTDEEFTDMRQHENPRVAALVDARLGIRSSIIETRLARLLDISTRGTIPIPITYSGARMTQRWAASKDESTNMQNTPRGSVIRQVLCAPPGHKLVSVDLSKIELCVARWLAANWYQDAASIETLRMIRTGEDVYCHTASSAYGRTITKADVKERQAGKETDLSCQYRVGHVKLNQRLRTAWGVYLDPGMDKKLVDTFRSLNAGGVAQAWRDLDEALKLMAEGGSTDKFWPCAIDGEHIDRPSGLSLWYPQLTYEAGKYGPQAVCLRAKGRGTEKNYLHGGSLYNHITQSTARDVMSYGWRLLLKQDPIYHPIMTVHDELIACVPDDEVENCTRIMSECMTSLPKWARDAPHHQLPLSVEADYGQNYKDLIPCP